ncbi:L-threonylcarbamoyladenylate synthase [Piscirickettsia litoralis]|uniref:Threonylcarbamoyl-AMP synthase n=1 Tax=Piscirickettsia litoralis TaxID=1891921 RepID=A0ABX3A3G2_9GAMM|nr:L-threonylcarbamoyladenylate synthase [Piscirickettsia litoralis]ODN43414.1 threonylcarbamoyl-AMP synthase [Piscirickettsia litoralis]
MAHMIAIHTQTPQKRLIEQVVNFIRRGGVIVYPTDAGYALGCHIDNKTGVERIRRIRRLDDKHHFTLLCRDLSEVGQYARVDNVAYRMLRRSTPGAYTFIFKATKEVPKRLQHEKKKTIGLRFPDHPIVAGILDVLGEPLINSSLILPDEETPLADPFDIETQLGKVVDVIIDGGISYAEPTTVIDWTESAPVILRQGKGDPEIFMVH